MQAAKFVVPAASKPTFRWRIVTVLLVVSLLPLCLMGGGSWIVFGRLLEEKAVDHQRFVVQSHARSIEAYLAEQLRLLKLVATTHPVTLFVDHAYLQQIFADLNGVSDGGFVDLGVISSNGAHLAYVGPFDLAGLNYFETSWFGEVMTNGVFVSDVFLGFRQVPHLVIAVRTDCCGEPWILRATINSEKFDDLVRSGILGVSGEAYLVNRDGLYQTTPKVGALRDLSPNVPLAHSGVRQERLQINGKDSIVMSTWLNSNRWQLVAQQDTSEVQAPVRQAMAVGALVLGIAMVVVGLTTFAATHHLCRRIDKANTQREQMFQAFQRSSKLASVGELATGLAHEINNPLAIISAERSKISDLLQDEVLDAAARHEIVESSDLIQRQVERCVDITSKMLRFGRHQESSFESTALAPRLEAITRLLEPQAKVRNVNLGLEIAPNLPRVELDPVELEQVLANLITNSFDALPNGGEIRVRARLVKDEVHIEVEDNGAGMPPEISDRVLEPFFTTKPAGQGTGLGLSVCHGIISGWGGHIDIDSEVNCGTTVLIRLSISSEKPKTESEA